MLIRELMHEAASQTGLSVRDLFGDNVSQVILSPIDIEHIKELGEVDKANILNVQSAYHLYAKHHKVSDAKHGTPTDIARYNKMITSVVSLEGCASHVASLVIDKDILLKSFEGGPKEAELFYVDSLKHTEMAVSSGLHVSTFAFHVLPEQSKEETITCLLESLKFKGLGSIILIDGLGLDKVAQEINDVLPIKSRPQKIINQLKMDFMDKGLL